MTTFIHSNYMTIYKPLLISKKINRYGNRSIYDKSMRFEETWGSFLQGTMIIHPLQKVYFSWISPQHIDNKGSLSMEGRGLFMKPHYLGCNFYKIHMMLKCYFVDFFCLANHLTISQFPIDIKVYVIILMYFSSINPI